MAGRKFLRGKFKPYQLQRSKLAVLRRYGLPLAKYASNQIYQYGKRKAVNQITGYLKSRRLSDASTSTAHGKKRKFYQIKGKASGPTYTTTTMIVKRTKRQQRFLRKLLKNQPMKNKFVNRFGFAWMGASAASKTIWYSVAHLKFNNICKYMADRQITAGQAVGTQSTVATALTYVGNGPDAFIYLGKCTFTYELYNPTNYIMTVWIYDLICKHDTPHDIKYNAATNDQNSAPEACMQKGSESMYGGSSNSGNYWTVADPTLETGTYFNTIGMKPTDYHLFNTMWKVKRMRKLVLPPTSSHHHIVVYNPKKKITNASLHYPRESWNTDNKNGVAGITQATLFGFQGQVAVENNVSGDDTESVGTLPGKLIISCVKKVNVWTANFQTQNVISENSLKDSWSEPKIFTDLIEQDAEAL